MKKTLNLFKLVKKRFAFSFSTTTHNHEFKSENYSYTPSLEFAKQKEKMKTFQVMDLEGNIVAPEFENIPTDLLNKMFEQMVRVEEVDKLLYMAQRQGKISFYMTSLGETAAVIGSTAALNFEDPIFPQYREQAALMWRGYSILQMLHQCMGNLNDPGKGRQMPVHYGSKELNYVTISSPLRAGYAFRIKNENKVAVTYFGEGAASEGDFHSAMNFAATLRAQTMFICRNNHYAISTPIADQYLGDGIASRGPGYGIASLRLDGNDIFAVYNGIKLARQFIIEKKEPVLVELITYRVGDHSTSDHSVLYRSAEELQSWTLLNNPINRLGLYLKKTNKRKFDENDDAILRKSYKDEAITALKEASLVKELFTDVYDDLTYNLKEQLNELENHLDEYESFYDLSKYEK